MRRISETFRLLFTGLVIGSLLIQPGQAGHWMRGCVPSPSYSSACYYPPACFTACNPCYEVVSPCGPVYYSTTSSDCGCDGVVVSGSPTMAETATTERVMGDDSVAGDSRPETSVVNKPADTAVEDPAPSLSADEAILPGGTTPESPIEAATPAETNIEEGAIPEAETSVDPITPIDEPADTGLFGGGAEEEAMPADDGGLFGGAEEEAAPADDGGLFGGAEEEAMPADDGGLFGGAEEEAAPADDGGLFGEGDPMPADAGGSLFGEEMEEAVPAEGGLFDDAPADDAPADGAPADGAPADDAAPADGTTDEDGGLFDFGQVLGEPGGMASGEFRTWTDNTGLHECQGRLISATDGYAKLLKDNGRTSTVKFSRLSDDDISFVNRQVDASSKSLLQQTAGR